MAFSWVRLGLPAPQEKMSGSSSQPASEHVAELGEMGETAPELGWIEAADKDEGTFALTVFSI